MKTIGIAQLKATLSAELRSVRQGESITVLDRNTPIAVISPIPGPVRILRSAEKPYTYRKLSALTRRDPVEFLKEERDEAW